MQKSITPAKRLSGFVRIPGDKSISHRYAMIASIADGPSTLENYSTGADCQSTLGCMRSLGVKIEKTNSTVQVHGQGLRSLRQPVETLDAGNSGSTIRMLSGILAAQPFRSRIAGDESLSRRPMERIMKPLAAMGASIQAHNGKYPPLEIEGGTLRPIDYTLPVASAQVKTCVLLAGLFADGETTVREAIRTRDHTELALREFGAEIDIQRGQITVTGNTPLKGRDLVIPGDLSSAAFFLVAALLIPESNVTVAGVGLNPTRSALIDFLISAGAQIKVNNLQQVGGELIGDLEIRGGRVTGGLIEKSLTAALIDELPVLAVLGAASESGLTVRDAGELRIKETDRIATLAENFSRMGLAIDVQPDGFHVPGQQTFQSATLDSFGDHRIAMAFSVAALAAPEPCTIENAEAASVSYPEFYDALASLRQ